VVSVAGKGGLSVRQVRAEKANESEPPMTCRKRIDGIKTGRELFSRDESGGYLPTAQAMPGIKAARAQLRLWCGTCEPVAPIPSTGHGTPGRKREDPKPQKRQGAEYRCGAQGRTAL
jgi:hypothetical protein